MDETTSNPVEEQEVATEETAEEVSEETTV